MKHLFPALPFLFVMALLSGCPQSKVPDTPPMVPQPKASVTMLQFTLEVP